MRKATGRSGLETGILITLVGLAATPALSVLAQRYGDGFGHIGDSAQNAPVFSLLQARSATPPALRQPHLPPALPNVAVASAESGAMKASGGAVTTDGSLTSPGVWEEPLPTMGSITTSAQGQQLLADLPAVAGWTPVQAEWTQPGAVGAAYRSDISTLAGLAEQIATVERQIAAMPTPLPAQLSQLNGLVTRFVSAYDAVSQKLPQESTFRKELNRRAESVYRTAYHRYLKPARDLARSAPPAAQTPVASTASSGTVANPTRALPSPPSQNARGPL